MTPTFYIKNLLPIDILVEFTIPRTDEKTGNVDKLTFPNRLEVNQEKYLYDFGIRDEVQVRIKIRGFNISAFQSIKDPNNPYEYKNYLQLIDFRGHEGKINMRVVKDGQARRIYFYSETLLINETKFDWHVFA